ncbi:CBS domain-containing protein [Actinomadura sp. 9N215]|uniref:CBS domain-containing protein n=1 Tax=Actinomadura sp. 9N215 TaxID=3375150 RepID=UPI0037BC112C
MRAYQLAKPFPVVRPDTSAAQGARLLCELGLPGLIVVDDDGERPVAVLTGPQILWSMVPGYVQVSPLLARVFDEHYADELCAGLGGRSVRDVLRPEKAARRLVVPADAQAMEIATLMAETGSALVAVVERGRRGRLVGAITVTDLFGRLLPAPGGTGPASPGPGDQGERDAAAGV